MGPLAPETPVHRIGGGAVENLRLKPKEEAMSPAGISVLLAGSAELAREQVRRAFPHATRLLETARTVGTATVAAIRQAGYDVIADPTRHFPNHGRLIHAAGKAGFTDANLVHLSQAFENVTRC